MKFGSLVRFTALLLPLLGACEVDTPDDGEDGGGRGGSKDAGMDSGSERDAQTADARVPLTDAARPMTDASRPESDAGGDAGDAATEDASRPMGVDGLAEGGDCPEATGAGTEHSTDITGNETWTAADGPHFITSSITVEGTLTIEACVTVVLSEGVSVHIGSSTDAGKLVTEGIYEEETATEPEVLKPVIFTSPAEDEYWGMLFVSGLGTAEFNTTALVRGGDASVVSTSRGGALVARGPNDGTLRRMITANLLVVVESGSFGITLESGAGFEESAGAGVVVQGTGRLPTPAGYNQDFDPIYPVFVEPPGVGTLPAGAYYGSTEATFAENDKILVVPRNSIAVDEQFHARGVPYLIHGSFYMRPTTTSTITITPGVELRFYVDPAGSNRGGMQFGDGASIDPRPVKLDIQGTAENPVVFTSDAEDPSAGDWVGLILDSSPSTGNKLSFAQILYAGADSQTSSYGCGPGDNDAAILITDWRPDDAFIQNVEIGASAGGGIMSGWSSDADGPDLKSGNVFSEIANGCDVSRWGNETGNACPDRTDEAPLCL